MAAQPDANATGRSVEPRDGVAEDPRVAALEARVAEQDQDIQMLKKLMLDLNGRVKALEGDKGGPTLSSPRPATAHVAEAVVTPGSARRPATVAGVGSAASGSASPRRAAARTTPLSSTRRGTPGSGHRLKGSNGASSGEGVVRYRHLRGAAYAPSDAVEPPNAPPATKLELEFVYGYRGKDCRDNLFYTASGEVAYFVAATGVVYSPESHTQRFFTEHDDDILSMAQHPSEPIMATGQTDPTGPREAYILLWNHDTMERVQLLDNAHQRSVVAMAFSRDGQYLFSIGGDDSHTLKMWDWRGGKVLTEVRTHKDHIFAVGVNPVTGTVVVTGKNLVKFITLERATDGTVSMRARTGITGKLGAQQPFLCVSFASHGLTVTGTYSGELYVWRDNFLAAVIPAHEGPVYAVSASPAGLLSGGRDGVLCVWNTERLRVEEGVVQGVMEELRRVQVGEDLRIRAINCRDTGRVVLGTLENDLYEVTLGEKGGAPPQVRALVRAHSAELWGLAEHPTRPMVATSCDAGVAYVVDLEARQVAMEVPLPADLVGKHASGRGRPRGLAWSPDGAFLAVGFEGGTFCVYAVQQGGEEGGEDGLVLAHRIAVPDRKEAMQVLRFSPTGERLAIGSHDNFVDLFDVADSFKRVGVLKGHSSFITSLDWSADAAYIRSTSGDYELLYWDIESVAQVLHPSTLRDVAWASHSTLLGWGAVGIWRKDSDGTDVNACACVHGAAGQPDSARSVLATGDDFGNVCLFHYPACIPNMERSTYKGHSAHVTNVAFSCDDSRLVSTGGNDMAVFQWRVVPQ